jgi:hypothetical protein
MASINIEVTLDGGLFSDPVPGILTTDHASSSHGLPVVVVDGKAYGPGDMNGGHIEGILEATPEYLAADWQGEFTGQKWTTESLNMAASAMAVGYYVLGSSVAAK